MNTYKFTTMSGTFFIDAVNVYDAINIAKNKHPNTIIKKEYIKRVK